MRQKSRDFYFGLVASHTNNGHAGIVMDLRR